MTPLLEVKMNKLTVSDINGDSIGANELYLVANDNSSDSNSEDSLGLEAGIFDNPGLDDDYDITTIARDISSLFKQNNFFGILSLVPTLHKFHVLPASMRIIIALTLFILGRVGGALREVSLVIETENDPADRERYIQCLICFFQQLEMPERAYACFEEIIDIAKAEQIISKDDRVRVKALEEKIKNYKLQLSECLYIKPKT